MSYEKDMISLNAYVFISLGLGLNFNQRIVFLNVCEHLHYQSSKSLGTLVRISQPETMELYSLKPKITPAINPRTIHAAKRPSKTSLGGLRTVV